MYVPEHCGVAGCYDKAIVWYVRSGRIRFYSCNLHLLTESDVKEVKVTICTSIDQIKLELIKSRL